MVPASTGVFRPGERLSEEKGRRKIARPHLPEGPSTVSPKAMTEAAEDWVKIRSGEGTKGLLEGRFTRRKVRVCRLDKIPTEEVGWLLLESTSDGVRSWICWGSEKASVGELAALAHRRRVIERFHEEGKMELGLDHFEGRRWRGLNHHLTLVLISRTFRVRDQVRVSAEGAEERGAPEEAKTPVPTLAEMRRRVVMGVAWALVSRAVYSRRTEERRVGAGRSRGTGPGRDSQHFQRFGEHSTVKRERGRSRRTRRPGETRRKRRARPPLQNKTTDGRHTRSPQERVATSFTPK